MLTIAKALFVSGVMVAGVGAYFLGDWPAALIVGGAWMAFEGSVAIARC